MVSAPVRRCQVTYAHGRGVSIRRACALMSLARSTLRFEWRLLKRDAPAIAVMQELAAHFPLFALLRSLVLLLRRVHLISALRALRPCRRRGLFRGTCR